jgi:hypothetical protein
MRAIRGPPAVPRSHTPPRHRLPTAALPPPSAVAASVRVAQPTLSRLLPFPSLLLSFPSSSLCRCTTPPRLGRPSPSPACRRLLLRRCSCDDASSLLLLRQTCGLLPRNPRSGYGGSHLRRRRAATCAFGGVGVLYR